MIDLMKMTLVLFLAVVAGGLFWLALMSLIKLNAVATEVWDQSVVTSRAQSKLKADLAPDRIDDIEVGYQIGRRACVTFTRRSAFGGGSATQTWFIDLSSQVNFEIKSQSQYMAVCR